MRVYLAGKIGKQYGAWRDAILPTRHDPEMGEDVPVWVLLSDADDPEWGNRHYRCSVPWPRAENRHVLGSHEYVGPYRTDLRGSWDWKHYGEFHGSKVAGQHGASSGAEDGLIVEECRQAIARSDLVFAYINRPDCFGTLVELGYAKALGIFTALAIEVGAEWDESDYWFVAHLVDAVIGAGKPIEVGEEPRPTGIINGVTYRLNEMEQAAWADWYDRKILERQRIRGALKDAIVAWAARHEKAAPIALVPQDQTEPYIRALQEAANSLSQIARWSSDPRVRNEAQRMLKRIAG